MQLIEQRPGAGLSNMLSQFGGLAANFLFDAVEDADARQRLDGRGRSVDDMNLVKLAPRMSLIQSSG